MPSEKPEVLQLQRQRADIKGQLPGSSPQLSAGYESCSKHDDNGKAESDGLKRDLLGEMKAKESYEL